MLRFQFLFGSKYKKNNNRNYEKDGKQELRIKQIKEQQVSYSRFSPPFWLPSELVPVSLQQLQASSREIPRFGYRRSNFHSRPRVPGQFRESTIGFCSANVPAFPGLGGQGFTLTCAFCKVIPIKFTSEYKVIHSVHSFGNAKS